jgi:DNA mismatch repair ATPase MutS
LQHLARLLDAADARFSGMLHPVLAVGLLWDVHVAAALETWRAGEGEHTPVWLETLGQLEALSALATLAADHPDWCWPEAGDEAPPIVRATALGHPLLPEDQCVRNDVEIGPPGTVLLVTGSNMSGKSTLLRSVGVAAVLARAGGPACARRFSLPPVRVFTSMRVQDSLEEGVSFFMAELRRLQAILKAARHGPTLLYLVDEILQGTNSEERRIAGRRFVRHLIRRQAVGAVTTHDLELHLHPELEPAVRLVHFRESVRGGTALDFDYRLRPGLATTRNALALAEAMGLDEPTGPAPGGSGAGS